jgi:predicted DNA repair protein MutK
LGRAVVDHDASTTADALIDAVAIAGCTVTDIRPERRLPVR